MKRDINDIHDALYGGGTNGQALIHQVEQLVRIADRGRFSLRVALWLGGGIVACDDRNRPVQASDFGNFPPMMPISFASEIRPS